MLIEEILNRYWERRKDKFLIIRIYDNFLSDCVLVEKDYIEGLKKKEFRFANYNEQEKYNLLYNK